MTDLEVVESLDNAWRALCRQYDDCRCEQTRQALNMLAKITDKVKREVEESHRETQITIEEWLAMLNSEED